MGTQRGDDFRVDVGDPQVERVALRKVLGANLENDCRKRAHDLKCGVGGARVDHDHLARRQCCRVKDSRQGLTDEACLVLGANDDRDARI